MKSSMVGIFLSFLILEGGKPKGSKEIQNPPWSLHLDTPLQIDFHDLRQKVRGWAVGLNRNGR
jgi:hypothetical protein